MVRQEELAVCDAEEVELWEVTVKGGALGAGTKGGRPCFTTFAEVKCGKRTT